MDRVRSMALLTLVGGALTAVGSILPWATIASGIGSISKAGTEGDGIFARVRGRGHPGRVPRARWQPIGTRGRRPRWDRRIDLCRIVDRERQ